MFSKLHKILRTGVAILSLKMLQHLPLPSFHALFPLHNNSVKSNLFLFNVWYVRNHIKYSNNFCFLKFFDIFWYPEKYLSSIYYFYPRTNFIALDTKFITYLFNVVITVESYISWKKSFNLSCIWICKSWTSRTKWYSEHQWGQQLTV